MFEYPALSLVIPTWNRKKTLDKILFSLTKQNFKRRFEIIICDSNSRDGTKELIKKYISYPYFVIRHYNLENNISVKRNFGLKFAQSDNIIFIDDDCVPERSYLNKFYELLKNSDSNIVYCGLVKFPKKKLLQNFYKYRQSRHFSNTNNKDLDEGRIVTMNMGIKRNLIQKKQEYFDKNLGVLGKGLNGFEDYEFAFRLKKKQIKIVKCNCTIFHFDERNLKEHAKKFLIFGKYTIHKLEEINFEACKKNYYYKLKKNLIIKFLTRNTILPKIMIFLSKLIINLDEKSYKLGYFNFKFVLLSYYVYGLSIKNNAKQ